MTAVTLNGRWTLELPEHREKQWAQEWERPRLESMFANLMPDDVIVDVGAEEGDLPCLWASWGCYVAMAEPNPPVWRNIRACFEMNGLADKVLACWVGFLGDMHRDPPAHWNEVQGDELWPVCSRGEVISNHGFAVITERPDIPVSTLDALVAPLGTVNAITIDVEGAELRVLRGARGTLQRYRPLVWVSVHEDERWMAEKFPGEDAGEVYKFMRRLGYKRKELAVDHERHVFFYPYERAGEVVLP